MRDKGITNIVCSSCCDWLDQSVPNWKASVIDFFDVNFPQHVTQVRFLLGVCPPGQTLPTIMEEEEEGRPSDTEDGEDATDGVTAHLDTTKEFCKSVSYSD